MAGRTLEQILTRSGITGKLAHARTLTSAVTTAWGVNWDEEYIARDLMQNFFDANRDQLDQVLVQNIGPDVVISAPASVHLERLFYLGSEKGEDDVGQYGEGFKVAAACLLRDHGVTPIALSGNDVAVLQISERTVADTQMCPIEYDFYRNDHVVPGTVLVLPGCSRKLIQAMKAGLSHFFHDGNPLLGAKLWSSSGEEFQLYESSNTSGHIFYRKLKRGEIEGIPVVLVINKQYQSIERKISKDRDRNAFGEEVMRLFFNQFAEYGLKYNLHGQQVIVQAAKSCWEKGHPLLSEIAGAARSSWPSSRAMEVFGCGHYARSSHDSDASTQLEIDRLERCWREEGRQLLPGYFRAFGVINAEVEIRQLREKANEESKKNNQRRPTTAEQTAIHLLSGVLQELAPEIAAVFNRRITNYTVAKTEVVLGQLKSDRSYRSHNVFLAESVFVSDFPEALATFLHEHAHIFGYDGSRGFTDSLTGLLETVVRLRNDLDPFEAGWEDVRDAIRREREKRPTSEVPDEIDSWLTTLDEAELRSLVAHVPRVVLKKLRSNTAELSST